ncbi:MAG: dihydrodipicolinate synthetase [Planctomycetota bacterium]|mgnify:CR=1 FL=1|nr:MAG: dihydrodipicolinate synthetase [Planctomycetota bacterium]
MHRHIEGFVAAPFTPMNADGTVNLDIIEQQARFLQRNNVGGVFICGTTGEGLSLTTAERMQIMTRWAEVAGGKMTLIAHVGHNSIVEARSLAAGSRLLGFDAVGAIPPVFYKPRSVDELVAWCADIAAAADLPFYYYHTPSMTGVDFAMADFLNAAKDKISNLAGVKFTYENLADYAACLAADDGRFDILFGRDEILLAGLALGAKGAVGSTYNFVAGLYTEIIDAFAKGDLKTAQTLQNKSIRIINAIAQTPCGFLPAAKSILKMLDLDLGPVRRPLQNITEADYNALRTRLEKINFFNHAAK